MRIVVATRRLENPGGSETYALTVAEHAARLGHSVVLCARELGDVAAMARERGLWVERALDDLPNHADGVIVGLDRSLALDLARRYPHAARLFVVHGVDDIYLPPPLPGAVAATIALNDRQAERAAACVGAGEVIRLRQPIDLRRFSSRGRPADRPRRVLLLGNYHSLPAGRGQLLREAWSAGGLEWREAGGVHSTKDVAAAIAEADVVVGYGRSALEGMACGRPVYVHDHAGTQGWVSLNSYPALEAGGFAVAGDRAPRDAAGLREDLDAYRPELGQIGQDLARAYHDARDHVSQLIGLLQRLAPEPRATNPSAMRALAALAEAQLRLQTMADDYYMEVKQWSNRYNELQHAFNALKAELDRHHALQHAFDALKSEHDAAVGAQDYLRMFEATRRYRIAQALARPLDLLRARRRREP